MNNEIKEILDNIRKIIKLNRENDFNRIIYDCDSMEKLLDYITNLQEENNKLKDTMAKIKDLNTMQYLRDDIFKGQLSDILQGENKE